MNRSIRFFEIIQILRQSDKPIRASDLSQRLEVTMRTIYRDIASLQASGLPIEGAAGVGYILRAGYELPPLMFTQEEVEAIVVGISMLGRSADKGLIRAAQSASDKLAGALPSDVEMNAPLRVSSWNDIPKSRLEPAKVRDAIRASSVVQINYTDLNEATTHRTIKPIALLYYIDAILVAGWCELRAGFRHFRIDRISEWAPTKLDFREQAAQLRQQWEQSIEKREHGSSI